MKRKLIPLVSVVAVALAALTALAGTATAHRANQHRGWFGPGFFAQQDVVKGTVTAVNASAGTFTATIDAMENNGFGGGHFFNGPGNDGNCQGWGPGFRDSNGFSGGNGSGGQFHGDQMQSTTPTTTPTPTPAPSTVTITTNSSTKFDINGNSSATIANLAAGDRFIATFAALPGQGSSGMGSSVRLSHWDQGGSTPTVPTTPALAVIAEAPPQLYAFIGTVAAAPTALPGSLQVTVTQSIPAGLFSGAQTFQIGSQTLVFGGGLSSMFGSMPTIAQNDVVVGGEIGMGGETAAQVEANPLQVLVDFTSTTSNANTPAATTPAVTAMAKRMKTESFNRALKRLMKHHRKTHRAHHAKAHR